MKFRTFLKFFKMAIAIGVLSLHSFVMASEDSDGIKTVVLGDVEGQWERLESFIQNSSAFEIQNGIYKLKPNHRFVFMGDAVDKGNASLRILSTFLGLKESHPDQVVLILGNRDINKLRLPFELSQEGLSGPPNEETATQSFRDWLTHKQKESQYSDGVTRLKWILEKTMGAPKAFEFRREELQSRSGLSKISDQDVFQSFLSDFDPEKGLMGRYLSKAQLAYVDKQNGTLFVHGGLTTESLGFVPGEPRIADFNEWILRLNQWAYKEIVEGIQQKSGASRLVRYQQPIPGTNWNQGSVVYSRNFDLTSNPTLVPTQLREHLIQQGINTIVVGHTPVGEVPVIISDGEFRIVFVDNSFSKTKNSARVSLQKGTISVSAKSPEPGFGETLSYEHRMNINDDLGKNFMGWRMIGENKNSRLFFRIDATNRFQTKYKVEPIPVGVSCKKIF